MDNTNAAANNTDAAANYAATSDNAAATMLPNHSPNKEARLQAVRGEEGGTP